jgi:hypothetical protein
MRFSRSFRIALESNFLTILTGYTGLALGAYQPVSGNWCWISSDDRALRYALGHAWRLTIISTIICLFTYLFIFVHRHFSSMRSIGELNALEGDTDRFEGKTYKDDDLNGIHVYNEFETFIGTRQLF